METELDREHRFVLERRIVHRECTGNAERREGSRGQGLGVSGQFSGASGGKELETQRALGNTEEELVG